MASELRERRTNPADGSAAGATVEEPAKPKSTRRDPPPEPLYQQVGSLCDHHKPAFFLFASLLWQTPGAVGLRGPTHVSQPSLAFVVLHSYQFFAVDFITAVTSM